MNRRLFIALSLAALTPLPRLARAAQAPVVFVVHPFDTPSHLFEHFRPLSLYLSNVLGQTIRLVIARNHEEQIAMLIDGRAQLAYLDPAPYVVARENVALDILAGKAEGCMAFYQSAIVVRSNSRIRRLADLKGRSVAFGAENTMASAIAPRLMLAEAGLKLSDLGKVAYLERHERVALSVLHGDMDAGGLRLDVAKTYLPRGLRIIAKSPSLPPHVIAAGPTLPAAAIQKVRKALLLPDEAGQDAILALGENTAFVQINDSDFNALRRLLKKAGPP